MQFYIDPGRTQSLQVVTTNPSSFIILTSSSCSLLSQHIPYYLSPPYPQPSDLLCALTSPAQPTSSPLANLSAIACNNTQLLSQPTLPSHFLLPLSLLSSTFWPALRSHLPSPAYLITTGNSLSDCLVLYQPPTFNRARSNILQPSFSCSHLSQHISYYLSPPPSSTF